MDSISATNPGNHFFIPACIESTHLFPLKKLDELLIIKLRASGMKELILNHEFTKRRKIMGPGQEEQCFAEQTSDVNSDDTAHADQTYDTTGYDMSTDSGYENSMSYNFSAPDSTMNDVAADAATAYGACPENDDILNQESAGLNGIAAVWAGGAAVAAGLAAAPVALIAGVAAAGFWYWGSEKSEQAATNDDAAIRKCEEDQQAARNSVGLQGSPEETTMRSSSVSHEDPPPPARH